MTKVTISKWGDSPAIRLTQDVMDALGVEAGQEIEMVVEKGKLAVSSVRSWPVAPTLDWIVSEMQRLGPENEPETVDWGPDVGDEIIHDAPKFDRFNSLA